jgi:predicted DCC family thiol-disulfide oxidoreductase YuxK
MLAVLTMASAFLLYDADCGVCNSIAALVLALDRGEQLEPVAIASPRGAALLVDLEPERRLESWHLVKPDGSRSSAGAAVIDLAELLAPRSAGPTGRAAARALATPASWLYGPLAARRSTLGRLISDSSKRRAAAAVAARSRSDAR